MDIYALYSYSFETADCVPGNFYQSEEVKMPDPSENRPAILDQLFGVKKDNLPIPKKRKGKGSNYYPCTVLLHQNRVAWLRLENEKMQSRYVKTISNTAEADPIDKVAEPTSPYSYIFVDCREGRNLIAIRKNSDAWRSTDTEARLLEECLNKMLFDNAHGFKIKIQPVTIRQDFWDYNKWLIKNGNRRIKKMTIFFLNGTINAKTTDIINSSPNLKALQDLIFKGVGAKLIVDDPQGEEIIKDRNRDLKNIIEIITSNLLNPNFGLSLSYDNGTEVSCGKDIRVEFEMKADLITLVGGLFGEEFNIYTWLDDAAEYIQKQNGEATGQTSTGKNPTSIQDTSAALDML